MRKNFALIYELLDEVMDYGLPQILDADLLKMYITQGKGAGASSNVTVSVESGLIGQNRTSRS